MTETRPGLPDPGTLEADAPSYYRRTGPTTFRPTRHAQGAWQPGEQHMAALTGLLTHAVQQHQPRAGLQPARLAFEVLGLIPALETTVTVRTVRPGRTIELVAADAEIAGRPVVRARVWRLAGSDTAAVAGGAGAPLPAPEDLPAVEVTRDWPGGFIASLDVRAGTSPGHGRNRAWLRARPALVAEEEVDDLARLMGLVDTANGIACRLDPRRWMFPNTDLTVHLHRLPTGDRLGLATEQVVGPSGLGLTSSVLHDRHGPVGRAEQVLTVRPLPRADPPRV